MLRRLAPALRRFATAAPQSEDMVSKVFVDQQTKFRALVKGAQGMTLPLDGDAAAVAKFKGEYDALRKKVGVLSADERLALSLSSLRESAADVRSYLEGAEKLRTEAGVSDTSGAGAALQEALEAVEKAAGKPLLFADAKGMASLKTALAATQTKLGLKDAKVADLAAASATEETEVAVAAMKRARDEAVAAAKARDGLAL